MIRGTNYLRAKKYGGLKWTMKTNLKDATYFTHFFFTLVLCLPIQPSLKKNVWLGSNLHLKGFNCVK